MENIKSKQKKTVLLLISFLLLPVFLLIVYDYTKFYGDWIVFFVTGKKNVVPINRLSLRKDKSFIIYGKQPITGKFDIENTTITLNFSNKFDKKSEKCRKITNNKMIFKSNCIGDYAIKNSWLYNLKNYFERLYLKIDTKYFKDRQQIDLQSKNARSNRTRIQKKIKEKIIIAAELEIKIFKILDYYKFQAGNLWYERDLLYGELLNIGRPGIQYYFKYLKLNHKQNLKIVPYVLTQALIYFNDRSYLPQIKKYLIDYHDFLRIVIEWNDLSSLPIVMKGLDSESKKNGLCPTGIIDHYVTYLIKLNIKDCISLLKKVYFRQYPRYCPVVSTALAKLGDSGLLHDYKDLFYSYNNKQNSWPISSQDKLTLAKSVLISGDKHGIKMLADLYFANESDFTLKENIINTFRQKTLIPFQKFSKSDKVKFTNIKYINSKIIYKQKYTLNYDWFNELY